MKNKQIAKIFFEIADILETQGVQWKPAAYRKAAITIESLSEDIEEVWKRGELKELPGVGENIARKIDEILKTGTLGYYERLKKELPVDFEELTSIQSLGPKRVKKLYERLGVKNISDLQKALKEHKIRGLEGFGEKSEEDIANGIELLEKTKGRALLGFALPEARAIMNKLKKHSSVGRISIAGSARRMKETIGDIDILITSSRPAEVMDLFTSLPEVERVLAKGPTKTSVMLKMGLGCDIRVLDEGSFGSALQYFTGSKEHNIHLRRIAISKGLKLSEYGIFRGEKKIAGKTEEEVYAALGLPYIPAELREDEGEIEAAEKGKLPKLVEYADIKGDLHVHTKWSDGSHSIEEMAAAARKMGTEYICIADHSKGLGVARGLDEKRLSQQLKEIEKLELGGITVLKGAEVNILKDGRLDFSDKVLKGLDVVIGAVHSNFNMEKEEMTGRIGRAMENEHMDILAHPTGRLIGRREGYHVDIDKILEKAKETKTAIEINAWPERLDISDVYIRQAVERGVMLSIGTDSHAIDQLHFIELGVGMARRGWCGKKDVLNTFGPKEMLKKLK